MGASTHIGRVGALAVALGIGAAVSTGHGIARATEEGSEPETTESSPTAGADVGQDAGSVAESSSQTTIDTPSAITPPEKPGDLLPSLTTVTTRVDSLLSSLHRAAERGVAISTGGAITSRKVTGDKPDDAVDTDTVVEPTVAKPAAKKSSGPDRTDVNDGLVRQVIRREALPPPSPPPVPHRILAVVQQPQIAAGPDTITASVSKVMDNTVAPIVETAAAAVTTEPVAPRLLTNLMSVLGLGGLSSDTPGAPLGTPLVMALLALGVRRESESVAATSRTAATGNSPIAALTLANPSAAAVTAPSDPATAYPVVVTPVSANTDLLTNVTGPGGLNNTGDRFGIGGTDLGIMWDNGIRADNPATTVVEQRQVLVAFGDTFRVADPPRTGDWTINTLLRSSDQMLNNGMYVRDGVPGDIFSGSAMNPPRVPAVGSPGYAVGPEVTIIPTAGISAPYANAYGTRQYMSFMSVRSWDQPGFWTTNYSGIAYSDDNGQTWKVAPESIRPAASGRSTKTYVSGNQNFQQFAFVKPAAGTPEAAAGYVYAYGTPSGRGGTVYLSRVKQDQILDQTKYEYWNGTGWVVNKPSAATPVLPGTTTTSFFGLVRRTTYPTAGEMSVQYNQYEKKYIMLYADQNNNIVMRKADRPEGPWSAPTTLVTSTKMPGLYAPMIHPWSSENVQEAEKQYLYWNLSTWGDYEVKTMRTDLNKV